VAERVLIVDDEERIRKLLVMYLEKEGYIVDEASNGNDGLERLKYMDYSCVLLDVQLPMLNGKSILSELRKTKATPVIIMSAQADEQSRVEGFELGADDYVIKPFSPRELMLRINAILQRTKRSVFYTPELYTKGLVAVEDANFWKSSGWSPKGVLQGVLGRRGGSTIEQQLIKNTYYNGGRGYDTITRKIHELFLAIQMDHNLSKEEILTYYINKLENNIGDDINTNKILKAACTKLREIKDLCYEYMIMKFELDTYVKALLFYQNAIVMTQAVFTLLQRIKVHKKKLMDMKKKAGHSRVTLK